MERSHHALRRIRGVRGRVEGLAGRIEDETIRQAATELLKELTAIEEQITTSTRCNGPPGGTPTPSCRKDVWASNTRAKLDSQLITLLSWVETSVGRPTESSRQFFREVKAELDRVLTELEDLLEDRLKKLEK